jgi:hypothetical protein
VIDHVEPVVVFDVALLSRRSTVRRIDSRFSSTFRATPTMVSPDSMARIVFSAFSPHTEYM